MYCAMSKHLQLQQTDYNRNLKLSRYFVKECEIAHLLFTTIIFCG